MRICCLRWMLVSIHGHIGSIELIRIRSLPSHVPQAMGKPKCFSRARFMLRRCRRLQHKKRGRKVAAVHPLGGGSSVAAVRPPATMVPPAVVKADAAALGEPGEICTYWRDIEGVGYRGGRWRYLGSWEVWERISRPQW